MVEGKSKKVVKAYSVEHEYNLDGLISDYTLLLKAIIEEIWGNIRWKEKKVNRRMRIFPMIPTSKEFKRNIRNSALKNWEYASHYVDSAINTAYSIFKSWRKRYRKGIAKRKKPEIKRAFVYVKTTLFSYKDGKVKITIVPRKRYVEFDLKQYWFWDRVKNLNLGGIILKKGSITFTFWHMKEIRIEKPVGWDANLLSFDGYDGKQHYKISLKDVYTIHRAYELKRKRIQERTQKTKPKTYKRLMAKYKRREWKRVNALLHKISKSISNRSHIFEDLTYMKMKRKSKSRKKNRQLFKGDFIKLQKMIEYKANWNGYCVIYVNPRNTTKTCSRCGFVMKTRIGAVFKCPKCGLSMDRQKNASVNIFRKGLGMWGPGVAPNGDKTYDTLPMNPEGAEVDASQSVGMSRPPTLNPRRSPAEFVAEAHL